MTKERLEEIRAMTEEEMAEELLDRLSDAVKRAASDIALMKAVAKEECDVEPEEFDKALQRELRKEWNIVKDKTGEELALMAFAKMVLAGNADIEAIEIGDEEDG